MQNLTITFSHPWFLFLLIPALALTLIPYFMLSKKYRRTRNRITSMVLHAIVSVLVVLVVAGMQFAYQIPNDTNEILLVVDVSDTSARTKEQRDSFIRNVLEMGADDGYKIGVVTFGFDQVYAVPFTTDVDDVYDGYLAAELPDTSATNIAAALRFSKELFTNPEFGKIVLVTDGKETDENASAEIRSIAAQGLVVDTAQIKTELSSSDVQILDIEMSEFHVSQGRPCDIDVTINSLGASTVKLEFYDNDVLDEETGTLTVAALGGEQVVTFRHVFAEDGYHKLSVRAYAESDLVEENSSYCSYFFLQIFKKVLVLESMDDQSANLQSVLTENEAYEVDVFNIMTDDDIPVTVDALRLYDQVIMNNISNADLTESTKLPEDFVTILYSYVYEYGGGMLTIGGDDAQGEINAYNPEEYGSAYHQMLPVQAINYTPPIGVVVVVDCSGSMSATDDTGSTRLEWARAGAAACLDAMSERDYFGLMTLDMEYSIVLPMTPRTQESRIISAINSLQKASGGTSYVKAIDRAAQMLNGITSVDKRHMILVTDGEVTNTKDHEELIRQYYAEDGITVSIVAIDKTKEGSPYDESSSLDDLANPANAYEKLLRAAIIGHGRIYPLKGAEISDIIRHMREDLRAPEITAINEDPFYPTVSNKDDALFVGITFPEISEDEGDEESGGNMSANTDGPGKSDLPFKLGGFYGTKKRSNAQVLIMGEYGVPIYAQWKLAGGKGSVGSLMCDLTGKWSEELLADENGKILLRNIVNTLMPVNDIRPSEMNVTLRSENYINQVSIFTDLKAGETISGKLIDKSEEEEVELSLNAVVDPEANLRELDYYVTAALDESNGYTRCDFVLKRPGNYELVFTKLGADGSELDAYTLYYDLPYSEEYDVFGEETINELATKLTVWAGRGQGSKIEDLDEPIEIFENFITKIDKLADPRIVFLILAIVLFLGDIAVRKFKFKWPHELIRERKEKKAQEAAKHSDTASNN